MTLWAIRPMLPEDVPATLEMRGRTRENAVGLAEMAEVYGITPASAAAELRAGQTGWLCEEASAVMGFAIGDRRTGEVIVVAVLPSHEGRGIGRALLTLVQDDLLASGHRRLWLLANPDPAVRASGFYRHLGWQSTGEMRGEDLVLERIS